MHPSKQAMLGLLRAINISMIRDSMLCYRPSWRLQIRSPEAAGPAVLLAALRGNRGRGLCDRILRHPELDRRPAIALVDRADRDLPSQRVRVVALRVAVGTTAVSEWGRRAFGQQQGLEGASCGRVALVLNVLPRTSTQRRSRTRRRCSGRRCR